MAVMASQSGEGEPIPEQPPPGFFQKTPDVNIEDIGEPTNACFFVKSRTDPTDWYSIDREHTLPPR